MPRVWADAQGDLSLWLERTGHFVAFVVLQLKVLMMISMSKLSENETKIVSAWQNLPDDICPRSAFAL